MLKSRIKAVLVGSDVLLREGLARILADTGFQIIASQSFMSDGYIAEIGAHEPRNGQPLLLVIDASSDFEAAIKQIGVFKYHLSAGRVVLLFARQRPKDILAAFRAGANACLSKTTTSETLIKSLELVAAGETIMPAEIATFMLEQRGTQNDDDDDADGLCQIEAGPAKDKEAAGPIRTEGPDEIDKAGSELSALLPTVRDAFIPVMSARQEAILRCLIQGDTNKAIARKISISEATVKVHVKTILRKIRVHNRTQAAIWALNHPPKIMPDDAAVCVDVQESLPGALDVLPAGSGRAPRGPL